MHSVWYLADVRLLIFDALEPGDLARLARTCKAFFEFATDCLWRVTTSFTPFVCCLPRPFGIRPPELADIERMDMYGRKVRVFVMEAMSIEKTICLPAPVRDPRKKADRQPPKLWKKVWADVATLRPNSLFLPNLRQLQVSRITAGLLLPFVGISGASLTTVYMNHMENLHTDSLVRQFFDHLSDVSRLKNLFVQDGELGLVPPKLLLRAPLETLHLGPLKRSGEDPKLLKREHLLQTEFLHQPALRSLSITLTRRWCGPEFLSFEHKYLPSLKELKLNLTAFRTDLGALGPSELPILSWTCEADDHGGLRHANAVPQTIELLDCGQQSPTLFLKGLDQPTLDLLEIRFPPEMSGKMCVEMLHAVNSSCQLQNLTELALEGGRFSGNHAGWSTLPPPKTVPQDMWGVVPLLLPLPQLKVLHLSVASSLFTELDLGLYRSVADGLPALESLFIGQSYFNTSPPSSRTPNIFDKIPLRHVAAFCRFLPKLANLVIARVEASSLEQNPSADWACPGITSLSVQDWLMPKPYPPSVHLTPELVDHNLEAYFPNADTTKSAPLRRR